MPYSIASERCEYRGTGSAKPGNCWNQLTMWVDSKLIAVALTHVFLTTEF